MTSPIDLTLSSLRRAFHRRIEEREFRRARTIQLRGTIEQVVDATDRRIRSLAGYTRTLQYPVQGALQFIEALVQQIPGAIEISRNTFVSNPYVNAFFVNLEDVHAILARSPEIRDFVGENSERPPCCYALLCMHRSEKTVLGTMLVGDVLKRDVRQTAINFSDHQIYAATTNEAQTRASLRQCLFEGLVDSALQRIVRNKLASRRLQTERQVLHARLRRLRQRLRYAVSDGRDAGSLAQNAEAAARRLADIEQELARTPAATPREALELLTAVFNRPDRVLRLQHASLTLNKLGIKVNEDSRQPCNRLQLTEAIIGDAAPRVVTLASFPQDELLASTTCRRRIPPGGTWDSVRLAR